MSEYSQYQQVVLCGALVSLGGLIAYHDIRYLRIPNILTFLLAACGLIWATGVADHSLMTAIAGGTAGLAISTGVRWFYRLVRKQSGLGLGDVKLIGAACIWTGAMQLPALLLIACMAAFIHICILYFSIQSRLELSTKLPFGAHLVLALCCLVLFGETFKLNPA